MERNRIPLDTYDIVPDDMRAYLMNYGKHFNKKMYEFAVQLMRNRKKERVQTIAKEELENKLKSANVELENNVLYDACFVYCMGLSDVMGSSVQDEQHLLLYVKDLIDDSDQADGFIFNRWYADMVNKGMPIDWSEML